ncbi:hypothetical protein J2W51_003917 [Tardiphaga robiniae]|uniref:hypothetical protein n=1 Tax=Tardiphaga robiniae TaxID=943830 RepID=UPI00285CB3C3|nr:hypothetical protein [Tardiphaga robiniae]MDR6661331.1 hypothetical protein [Tardiphaga robiniae]
MTAKNGGTVIDLSARMQGNGPSVSDRIARRIVVLRQWLEEGIPMGKRRNLPASLRAAREWNDPEIGIVRIASPNQFSQNHPVSGDDVREVARLLDALAKRYAKPKHIDKKKPQPLKFGRAEVDGRLSQVVSQWHMERSARQNEQKRADAADQRARIIREENAELQRKLSVYLGPTIVS